MNFKNMTYEAAPRKKKSLAEEDEEFDSRFEGGDDMDDVDDGDDYDDLSGDDLLDKFDDEIEGVDLDDLDLDDLDDFADELSDDDLDVFDSDFDNDGRPSRQRHRNSEPDDDEIDDSAFYNDDFRDFDNYTTISDDDFDDDLDTYLENEGGGYFDDYDSRY